MTQAMSAAHNIETLYRLTPLQEGILFHTLERADPGLYVGQYTCLIDAELDPERLRLAWSELVRRHAVLRTLLAWKGREKPLQIVRERVELPWRYEDWQSEDAAQIADRWQSLMQAERKRGFLLDRAPLIRLALVRVGPRRHRFSLCYHHIILDGWSLKLLLDEATALYATPAGCELGGPSYAEYVDWLLDRDEADATVFWSSQLGDLEQPTRVPFSIKQEGEGHASHLVRLDRSVATGLDAVARDHRTTPGTLLIAAWALLLGRYADSDDVLFGTTWAGRPEQLAGCQRTLGLFINTLPTRVRVIGDEPVGDLLARVQQLLVEIREHGHTPLVQAQKASPLPAGQALFDSLIVIQSVPEAFPAPRPWVPEDETFFEYSNYPLALLLRPGERFDVSLVYDRVHVAAAEAARLVTHYLNIVRGIIASPNARIDELGMLADDEIGWLREVGRGPQLDVDLSTPVQGLMAGFAARCPDALALVQDDQMLSYADLSARAGGLASSLRRALEDGASVEPSVFYGAVFLERSPAALTAAFAVLLAGGSYVPLDPAYPVERNRLVLDDLQAASSPVVVVTTRRLIEALPTTQSMLVCIDDVEAGTGEANISNNADAYVMYTSGSTGRPKGTRVSQANLLASTAARNQFYGEPPTRFLLLSSMASDSSIAGIFWTLTGGGTLLLPRPREEQSMASIASIIRQQHVTHVLCLPSLYALLLEHTDEGSFDSLRTVIVAGEACPLDLVAKHHQHLPAAALYNEYGPSEATVWATVAQLGPDTREVTIGRPIANTTTRVVDRHGRQVPVGMPGELWIGGAGVACGYLGERELTDDRFVCHPSDPGEPATRVYRSGDRVRLMPDGGLRFLGRVDNQLKVRGHRVEPEEIERRLVALDGVRDAAIALAPDANGHERLTAFVVCLGEVPTLVALRQSLAASLPDFMLPQSLVVMDVLPRTPGGKIDAQALRVHGVNTMPHGQHAPPVTADEKLLAGIWSDVLGVDRVGIHDNFFELGGDSLLSIRILARTHKAGLDISPAEFFARPTVAEQAARVEHSETPVETAAPEKTKAQPFALSKLDAAGLAAVAKQLKEADD